jgi:hypothetical protein
VNEVKTTQWATRLAAHVVILLVKDDDIRSVELLS